MTTQKTTMTKAQQFEIKEAKSRLKDNYQVNALLTKPESNPKVAKNSALSGIYTAPLHLAPSDLSGYNVCPMASKGCKAACLHTAGNPLFWEGKDVARHNRTIAYIEDRNDFMVVLHGEIDLLMRQAAAKGMWGGIRLNATSDIMYENVSYTLDGVTYKNIMEAFPNISYYDYTKINKRFNKVLPENYHLTFSLSEDNAPQAHNVLKLGGTVAAVFGDPTSRIATLPETFQIFGDKFEVINGDLTDFRPDDPKGVIVGLKAKGDAIGDWSGFVQYTDKHHEHGEALPKELFAA